MLPTRRQWQSWSLPSKYSFIGLILAIIGLAPLLWSFVPNRTSSKTQFSNATALAESESIKNLKCINTIRLQIERGLDWPLCRLSTKHLDDLFQNNFYDIGGGTYGEDNTILYIWEDIHAKFVKLNEVNSIGEFETLERSGEFSLRDLNYDVSFFKWYISKLNLDGIVSVKFDNSTRPSEMTGVPDEVWEKWKSDRAKQVSGWPAYAFETYLGYLD